MLVLAREGLGVTHPAEMLLPEFERAYARGEFQRVSPQEATQVFKLLLFATFDGIPNERECDWVSIEDFEARIQSTIDTFLHGIA